MKEQIEQMYIQALIDDLPPNVFADQVLRLFNVSGCQFEAYARFCIECDRQGLKPIKYEDYLKIG